MQIVTQQSEPQFIEILTALRQHPEDWMSMQVQLAGLNLTMLEQEGLSRATLDKIHRLSCQIAEELKATGLDAFTGSIFVFKDGDVLALYERNAELEDAMLRNLRTEFKKNNLIQAMIIEPVNKRLSQLATYSRTKVESAEIYNLYERVVTMVDRIDDWTLPEEDITDHIQKKRRGRDATCILLIEDDALVRNMLNTMLKDDHQVVQAEDAKSGVLRYVQHAPNVVLLDINMPGLNGHETLARIKSLDPDAYIVMVSGNSSQDNVLSTYSNGAAGFVCKPFNKVTLRNYISDCPSLISKALAKSLVN